MNKIIDKHIYLILYIFIAFVYIAGTFIPVIENDSAQHAVMAMRIAKQNDFINLLKGGNPYLDKPHMHFWLAAIAYKVFGYNQFAYRIPALLFTIMAAYACYKLFIGLYKDRKKAHWAALIFLTAQAMFLANHDVRTDAVLTGAVIIAIWQLYVYIENNKTSALIIGAIAAGIAFSTKGLLGLLVIGFSILCYIIYNHKYKKVFKAKTLIGVLVLLMSISPVLYAYYIQFDMHPETIVEGHTNVSGVKFILWDQSFNRITAKGFDKNNPDYSFFFHTILWAFFPWGLLFYTAMFSRIKLLVSKTQITEVLTIGGILTTLTIISFSKTKLPHYLNSLMPTMAIFTAGFLYYILAKNKRKLAKILLYVVYFTTAIGVIAVAGMLLFTFKLPNAFVFIIVGCIVFFIVLYLINNTIEIQKILVLSVLTGVLVNTTLNCYFYPNLLKYQSGKYVYEYLQQKNNHDTIYIVDNETKWSLDFYSGHEIPSLTFEQLAHIKAPILIPTNKPEPIKQIASNNNIDVKLIKTFDDFRVSMVSLKFLNPARREQQVDTTSLLKLTPSIKTININ